MFENGGEEKIDFGDDEFYQEDSEELYEDVKNRLKDYLEGEDYNTVYLDNDNIEIEYI